MSPVAAVGQRGQDSEMTSCRSVEPSVIFLLLLCVVSLGVHGYCHPLVDLNICNMILIPSSSLLSAVKLLSFDSSLKTHFKHKD